MIVCVSTITPTLLQTQQGAEALLDVTSANATATTAAIFSGVPAQSAYLAAVSAAAPHIGPLADATASRYLSAWDEKQYVPRTTKRCCAPTPWQ